MPVTTCTCVTFVNEAYCSTTWESPALASTIALCDINQRKEGSCEMKLVVDY